MCLPLVSKQVVAVAAQFGISRCSTQTGCTPKRLRRSHHMGYRILASRRGWIGSALLLGTLLTTGVALAFWKISALKASEAAAATQPEPMEAATAAVASPRAYRPTTTSVG